jgi:hypothetical protein
MVAVASLYSCGENFQRRSKLKPGMVQQSYEQNFYS